MTQQDSRITKRVTVPQVEMVHIYHDRWQLPCSAMFKMLEEQPGVYAVYSVVAVVTDISDKGVGIQFQGQQIMSNILLRTGELYVLKLSLLLPELDAQLAPHTKADENYHYLLLKGTLRWLEQDAKVSKAGFELSAGNEPVVLDFVRKHFRFEGQGKLTEPTKPKS